MSNEIIINSLIGLVLALAAGFYFERRAARDVRARAADAAKVASAREADLERQLKSLRNSIYNMGGGSRQEPDVLLNDGELSAQLLRWVKDHLGADGVVLRAGIFGAFQHTTEQVESALQLLCDKGVVQVDGRWIRLP